MKVFPVLGGHKIHFPSVPWAFVAPHEEQAKHNHGNQSLERLAQRGGLAPSELVATVCGIPLEWMAWNQMNERGVVRWLEQRIRDWEDS